jgi:hypothetical protein
VERGISRSEERDAYAMTAPIVPIPGTRAVVTTLTVSGAALSVAHVTDSGPTGDAPEMAKKHAA